MAWGLAALTSGVVYGLLLWPLLPRPGADFKAFYTAARLLALGGNPYNLGALRHMQDALLNRGVSTASVAYYPLDPVANPPLFYWLLGPLTGLPPHTAYIIWTVASAGLTVGALALLARRLLPQAARRGLLVIAAVLALPHSMVNLIMGQPDALFLLALAGAALRLERGQPLSAGLLLTVGWIKPHVLLPVGVALLLTERSWRDLAGVLAGSAAWAAASLLYCPTATLAWIHYLAVDRGSGLLFGAQPTLPSLLGPLLGRLAAPLSLAAYAVAVLVLWSHGRAGNGRRLWARAAGLTALWLALAPYLHLNDGLLVALPLLLLTPIAVANRGTALTVLLVTTLLGLYLLPLANLWLGVAPALNVLPLLGLAAALWVARREIMAPVPGG